MLSNSGNLIHGFTTRQPHTLNSLDDKLLTGWAIHPLTLKNCCVAVSICLIETFCESICNYNTVHVIVCPRLNI